MYPGASTIHAIELKDRKTLKQFPFDFYEVLNCVITELKMFSSPVLFFTECGGKMHLREGEFEKAHTDFFEAFKNYDESGSPRRTTCLKYLVLANMLMKSGINPFDSQEVCVCSNY